MSTTRSVRAVRREDDDELVGFVAHEGGNARWQSRTVFGGLLGEHHDAESARAQVEQIGMSSLAERWWIDLGTGWEACSLVEASPERLVVVRSHHSFDGTPLTVPPGTPLMLTPPP